MEFDTTTTAVAFLGFVALGVVGLVASGVMPTRIVLMMVAPSMLVFGLVCLAIGVQFGQHRESGA